MAQTDNRVIQVTGVTPKDPGAVMVIQIDEAPMRAEMLDYSVRILNLSIFISLVTAALVFLSLRWLMVQPLERITRSMTAFRENPEERASDLDDLDRRDEIGVAMRELAAMKEGLRAALRQKTRLAALGTAVNKISHDPEYAVDGDLGLDSLALSDDPKVKKVAPRLIEPIDRAVALCSTTLNFTRDMPRLEFAKVTIADVVSDASRSLVPVEADNTVRIDQAEGADLAIWADRDQIHRVFVNLGKNACDAGATRIAIDAWKTTGMIRVDVSTMDPVSQRPWSENCSSHSRFRPGRTESASVSRSRATSFKPTAERCRSHGPDRVARASPCCCPVAEAEDRFATRSWRGAQTDVTLALQKNLREPVRRRTVETGTATTELRCDGPLPSVCSNCEVRHLTLCAPLNPDEMHKRCGFLHRMRASLAVP